MGDREGFNTHNQQAVYKILNTHTHAHIINSAYIHLVIYAIAYDCTAVCQAHIHIETHAHTHTTLRRGRPVGYVSMLLLLTPPDKTTAVLLTTTAALPLTCRQPTCQQPGRQRTACGVLYNYFRNTTLHCIGSTHSICVFVCRYLCAQACVCMCVSVCNAACLPRFKDQRLCYVVLTVQGGNRPVSFF